MVDELAKVFESNPEASIRQLVKDLCHPPDNKDIFHPKDSRDAAFKQFLTDEESLQDRFFELATPKLLVGWKNDRLESAIWDIRVYRPTVLSVAVDTRGTVLKAFPFVRDSVTMSLPGKRKSDDIDTHKDDETEPATTVEPVKPFELGFFISTLGARAFLNRILDIYPITVVQDPKIGVLSRFALNVMQCNPLEPTDYLIADQQYFGEFLSEIEVRRNGRGGQ